MAKSTTLTTASVLAFERNLDISDATFWQCATDKDGKKGEKTPVVLREKSVRGTISNRLKNAIANDPTKLDAEIEKANLQTVDVAMLDEDKNTLIASFTLKVLPFSGRPSVCNNQDYQAKLLETVSGYLQTHGTSELARRYAINLVNARWLWRNRIGAKTIAVTVSNEEESVTITDVKPMPLNDMSLQNAEIDTIAGWIEQGLTGKRFTLLTIEACADMGAGQEVFPSQELILDKGSSRKSKFLYEINGKAGMHSQKIGNAIRTIDNWYPEAEFPIAVEPYGAVTTLGTAFRQPKAKADFYSLFDNWVLKGDLPETEQQHYAIAVLIRGGVFGESGKE